MTFSPGQLAGLQPSRVCIIKPSSLGDVIHALPILAALRGRWPSAHLAWVVSLPFRDVLEGHADLDELIVYERAGRASDPTGTVDLFRRLLGGRFDLTIDLQGLLRSALMTAATRARVRVGLADAREGARAGFIRTWSMPLGSASTPWSASNEWQLPCAWTPPHPVLIYRSERPIGGGPVRCWRRS